MIDRPLHDRRPGVDALLEEAGGGALVVVDQRNNVGALVVRRRRARGLDVGYLPGKAMRQARDMLPGTAKADRIDARAIGRTALAATVDISLFDGDDSLASHCGLTPSDSRSGASIGPTSATRAGNRQLKNLLIFSFNSPAGTRNRFGGVYCDEYRSRDVRHNRALKAVPRNRPGAICAIMRDRVPYEEPPTAEKARESHPGPLTEL